VLVVSEELDELFEVCDRLHVIARGQLSPSLPVAEATVEKIGEWMSGLWDYEVQAHLAVLAGVAADSGLATTAQEAGHAQA
jgi:simple sugar transport system ATP-binding protein